MAQAAERCSVPRFPHGTAMGKSAAPREGWEGRSSSKWGHGTQLGGGWPLSPTQVTLGLGIAPPVAGCTQGMQAAHGPTDPAQCSHAPTPVVPHHGRTSRGVWGHSVTHALGTPVSPAHAWGQTRCPWVHPGTPGRSGCPCPHRPTDTSPSVPPWGQSPCCPRGAHGVTCTLLSPPSAPSQPSRHLSQPHGQRQRWGRCLCRDTQRHWHCCQPQGTGVPSPTPNLL